MFEIPKEKYTKKISKRIKKRRGFLPGDVITATIRGKRADVVIVSFRHIRKGRLTGWVEYTLIPIPYENRYVKLTVKDCAMGNFIHIDNKYSEEEVRGTLSKQRSLVNGNIDTIKKTVSSRLEKLLQIIYYKYPNKTINEYDLQDELVGREVMLSINGNRFKGLITDISKDTLLVAIYVKKYKSNKKWIEPFTIEKII